MSVLVTGGAGYIGSATVAALVRRGQPVVVYDNLSKGHRRAVPPAVPFIQADLADSARLRQTLREFNVSQVIHFAAFTSVPESVERPDLYFQNNTVNTLALLDAMRDAGADQIVFSSTASVYGEPRTEILEETHPKQPANPYGLSKRFVERILETYDAAFGLRHVALRYFNACGGAPDRGEDHDPETHLIPIALQVALGQRPHIQVFGADYPTGDGTCVRDYIHVDDLAEAHLLALDHLERGGASEQINLGNGRGYSVRQVIDVARAVTRHPIPEQAAPRRAGDPSRLVASSRKAHDILGWRPRHVNLDDIVASAWEWHRRHPRGYED